MSILGTYAQIQAKTFILWLQNRFQRLFRVNWRYRFKDIDENVYLLACKPVLRNSPQFYFQNFGGYFESIEGTFALIRAKTFIRQLRNWFFGIYCFIFRTLEVTLSQWEVLLPRYRQKHSFAGFDTDFTAFAVLFV